MTADRTPNNNQESYKPPVIITGAGSGIGAATAKYFSGRGHEVFLCARRKDKLLEVQKTLSSPAHIIPLDVTDAAQIDAVFNEISKKAPSLGILVNNAGIFSRGSFISQDDALWNKIYETNLLGPVRLCRKFYPLLKKNKGAVVNVASTAGLRPLTGMFAYSTFKSALIHFTQSLALEWAQDEIRVNAVCPGIVDTEILNLQKLSAEEQAKSRKMMAEMHPLKKLGKSEDIAWMIYQLSSSEAQWVTGTAIPVDGGISLL